MFEPITYILDLEKKTKVYLDTKNPLLSYPVFVGQQPDGKIIFTRYDNKFYRLNLDGTLDMTYSQFTAEKGNECPNFAHTILPDGSVVFTGDFSTINGTPRKCFAKLLPNGELDKNFDPKSGFQLANKYCTILATCTYIQRILYDGLGRIIVVGGFSSYQNVEQTGIAFIKPDGGVHQDIKIPGIPVEVGQFGNGGNDKISVMVDNQSNIWIQNLSQHYIFKGDNTIHNPQCLNQETVTGPSVEYGVCHADDREHGIYEYKDKLYIPHKMSIYIYKKSGEYIKQIQRPEQFRPSWFSYMQSGVKVGRYLYIGSTLGIDIIDMETDTWIKTLGHHKPDVSPGAQGALPADTLTTFQYNGETYVIRSDHMVYKVEGSKPTTIEEKYITFTPTSG